MLRHHTWSLAVFLSLVTAAFASAANIRFRLIDAETDQTTPAMVCISGTTRGEVRLPPSGAVSTRPSDVLTFVGGVRFESGRNWIGPVRKTNGQGDNNDRGLPYELRPSIPYWKEPVMYQTSGDFNIELPAGEWRVAVQRGMEYVPVVETFATTDQPSAAGEIVKEIELKRWIDLPQRGWWSGDVHVHHPTWAEEFKEFLIHYAIASDLHIVNLLEMGHHGGVEFVQRIWGKGRVVRGHYALVAGQEEPRSTFGHIIGLNMQGLARDVGTYDFYDLAFKRIHAQPGAVVGFAHFSWNGCDLPRGFPWYVTTGDIDFVELMQFSRINEMDYYDYLNLGFKLTAAAGSDVPWGSTIGEVRTYVHTGPTFDVDAWFAGLKAGRTFVSNGPALEFTVDGELPGAVLKRKRGDRLKIAAKALCHPAVGVLKELRVVGNDGPVLTRPAEGGSSAELTGELTLPLEHSLWLVASTVCENGAVAHTTPVYVEVDGQPTFSRTHGPKVIDRQLELIAQVEPEFRGKEDERSRGVMERIDKAKRFYRDLRERMLR